MSKIQRSLHNVTGDLTVNEGDIVVDDSTKGLILTNLSDDQKRILAREDSGTDVLEMEDV